MSFFSRLKKLVDPVQGRFEEYTHLDDTPPPEEEVAEAEKPPVIESEPLPSGEPFYRCKACGYSSLDPSYCPRCLADTMRRVKPPRRGKGA